MMMKLNPEQMHAFLLDQLDKAGLPHNTFTEDAAALLVRSAEGVIRRARNLALGCLLQAVRQQTRTVDLPQVNRVLMQPHWRNLCDESPQAPH